MCGTPTHVASSARTTFYYYSELKTWFEARDFCETNHASLASIRSADESRLLAQAMSGGVAGHGTWLGGTALDTEDPNFRSPRAAQIAPARNRQQSTDLSNWRWYPNDGASTGGLSASGVYLNWNNNEPNNGDDHQPPSQQQPQPQPRLYLQSHNRKRHHGPTQTQQLQLQQQTQQPQPQATTLPTQVPQTKAVEMFQRGAED